MKLQYTLIKDIPLGMQIEVNDFYNYFHIDVLLFSDKEEKFWMNLPNKKDILRIWFQQDVIGNKDLREALLHLPLNKTITFNMGNEFDLMDDKQLQECFNFMKTMKFEPNPVKTMLVKM